MLTFVIKKLKNKRENKKMTDASSRRFMLKRKGSCHACKYFNGYVAGGGVIAHCVVEQPLFNKFRSSSLYDECPDYKPHKLIKND